MVDRFLPGNISKLNEGFRTQMSNEHKMYSSGTEAYMQSTAPIQCMSDSDGSNLVVFGPIWSSDADCWCPPDVPFLAFLWKADENNNHQGISG